MKGFLKIHKLGLFLFTLIYLFSASIGNLFAADLVRSAEATCSVVKTGEVYTYTVSIKNTSTNPSDSIYCLMFGKWYNEPTLPPLPLKDAVSVECPEGWSGSIGGGEDYQGNDIELGANWEGSVAASHYIRPGETLSFKFTANNLLTSDLKIGACFYDGYGSWGGKDFKGYAKLVEIDSEKIEDADETAVVPNITISPSPSPVVSPTSTPAAKVAQVNNLKATVYDSVYASVYSTVNGEENIGCDYIKLNWQLDNPENKVLKGFNIYKSNSTVDEQAKPMTDFLIKDAYYVDTNIVRGKTYYYVCKAVFADKTQSLPSNEVSVRIGQSSTLVLQVDNPKMKVNGFEKVVDPERSATPVIIMGRTLLPARAMIETMGGTIFWNNAESKVTVKINSSILEFWINNNTAKVNGIEKTMDVPPQIIKDRTMLPLRFIIENLGCDVDWDADTKSITVLY